MFALFHSENRNVYKDYKVSFYSMAKYYSTLVCVRLDVIAMRISGPTHPLLIKCYCCFLPGRCSPFWPATDVNIQLAPANRSCVFDWPRFPWSYHHSFIRRHWSCHTKAETKWIHGRRLSCAREFIPSGRRWRRSRAPKWPPSIPS